MNHKAIDERDRMIVEMRDRGEKLDYIATVFGKTREGIAFIYKQKTGKKSTRTDKPLDKTLDSVYNRGIEH
jgi:hypothetical protein